MRSVNKFLILGFCALTPILAISNPDDENSDTTNKEAVTGGCDFTSLMTTLTISETTDSSFPEGTTIQVTEEDEVLVDGEPTMEVERFCQIEEGPSVTLYTAGYKGVININGCRHHYTYKGGHGRPSGNAKINLDKHINSPACNKPHGPRDNAEPTAAPHSHSDDGYHLGQAHGGDGNVEN